MKREPITLNEILFVAAAATSFLAFGQSVGWRVVGVAQLVFTFKILTKKEVGVGWEGFKPSFYLRGTAAIITGLVSLALSIMLLVCPEQTVMRWFDKP
jgi:hypothetical protein